MRLTHSLPTTSVIANDCSISITFVAEIEQSLVIIIVIGSQRVKSFPFNLTEL